MPNIHRSIEAAQLHERYRDSSAAELAGLLTEAKREAAAADKDGLPTARDFYLLTVGAVLFEQKRRGAEAMREAENELKALDE